MEQSEEQRTTALLTSDSGQHENWVERWGAETLPRNPDLPYHIDHDLLDDEEEATLPPDEDTIPPTEKLEGES